MVEIAADDFDEIVERAVAELPHAFRSKLDNVAVQVEEWPDAEDLDAADVPQGDTLFGLYQGVSYPRRGATDYTAALPDRLVIYRGPICEAARSRSGAARIVRDTVIHEIGHYFGLDEDAVRRAEKARATRRPRR